MRILVSSVSLLLLVSSIAFSPSIAQAEPPSLDASMMEQLKVYFDLDEEGVIDRLAAEAEAFAVRDLARAVLGDAYAGSWFDGDLLELQVAAIPSEGSNRAKALGLHVTDVEYNLAYLLEAQLNVIDNAFASSQWRSAFVSAGLNFHENQIVVGYHGVSSQYASENKALLHENSGLIRLEHRATLPAISSNVRGGDEFHIPEFDWECSTGFGTEGGYFTAGHCGDAEDAVEDGDNNPMGEFGESDWPVQDIAWVELGQGWSSTYEINGYTDGIVQIPSDWGGYRDSLVNTTVCRTGFITEGFHCGTVLAVNESETFTVPIVRGGGTVNLSGLVKTDACQLPGDSGGPFILANSNLAQGTLVGGWHTSCPGTSDGAWYEPIEKHMVKFVEDVLTPHGSNPPSIKDSLCPDTSLQASGQFVCHTGYDSQGLTDVEWEESPGQTGSHPYFFGTCTPGFWVTVDLEVSSRHGSDTQNFGFTCPSSP